MPLDAHRTAARDDGRTADEGDPARAYRLLRDGNDSLCRCGADGDDAVLPSAPERNAFRAARAHETETHLDRPLARGDVQPTERLEVMVGPIESEEKGACAAGPHEGSRVGVEREGTA